MAGEVPPNVYRETVYVAKHDRILTMPRTGRNERGQIYACDLAAGNQWTKTGIQLPPRTAVGPNTAMVYDADLDCLVLLYAGNKNPVGVWMMRYAPAALGRKR